ncbi:MAG: trypsin-like peptidase domain-containing protein [Candidatus Komeilibacteria bacterium]|nr:trypsin-like peptidase domain-containing protein [Candidatus Komeilibacteria bacterium]
MSEDILSSSQTELKNNKPHFSLVGIFLLALLAGLLGGIIGVKLLVIDQGLLGTDQTTISWNKILAGLNKGRAGLNQDEVNTIGVVKQASPAVVSILISKEVPVVDNSQLFNQFFNFNFDQFGWPQLQPIQPQAPQSQKKEKQQIGGGSGFIVAPDGLIVTNKHVVLDDSAEYTVLLANGKKYPAKIVGRDPVNDLAVLKIEAINLPTLELGDSSQVQIGQTVIAIGYTLAQYSNTVTKGVISGVGREVVAGDRAGQSEKLQGVIQTDAAINPGNSGGPLLDLGGRVIGINTAINQGGQLIGFAIPVNTVKSAIESAKKNGKIIRAYVGVRYVMLNEEIVKKNQLPIKDGALVLRGEQPGDLAVVPGSPADKAGLVENDIILAINGQKIDSDHPLVNEINKYQVGQTITLKVWHKGETKEVELTLEEYKG